MESHDEGGHFSFGGKLAYAVSDLGITLPLSTISFFLLYFYTDVAGLAPYVVGLAITISKLWDAVADPFIGMLSDRTTSRWGRRRPFLLFGALPYALTFVLLWAVGRTHSEAQIFISLLVVCILFFTSASVIAIPYNSILAELSFDPHERTKLMAWRQPFSVLGWVAGSALILPIVKALGGGRSGFLGMAAAFGVVAVIVFMTTFFGVREHPRATVEKPLPLLRSLKLTLESGSFRIFIFVYSLASLGYTVLSSVLVYYAKYWLGDANAFTVMMGIVMGVLLLSVPLWVRLSGKIGKKESLLVGLGVLIIASFLLLIYPRGAGLGLYLIMVVAGAGTGAYFLLPYAILPEIVDEDELATGTRREGAYFGIYFFLYKLAIALAPLIIGGVLGAFGYVSDSELSDRTLLGIRSLVGGVPLILFIASAVMLIRFPLTKARNAQIAKDLGSRRDARADAP